MTCSVEGQTCSSAPSWPYKDPVDWPQVAGEEAEEAEEVLARSPALARQQVTGAMMWHKQ